MKRTKILLSSLIMMTSVFAVLAAKKDNKAENIADSNNEFAFDLYSKLSSEEGNIFFSPYSISTALGMTYAGAKNNTEKQMSKVLHFSKNQQKISKSFGLMQEKLNGIQEKGDIKLGLANAIWTQMGYKFLDSYINLVQDDFKSKINQVDFVHSQSREKARKEINGWVETKTNNKIRNLIAKGILNDLTRMVLVNAIFFKGDWKYQFKERSTNKNADFFTTPDKKTTVAMMYQKNEFRYTEDKSTLVLEMPYKGNELSMLVLLPRAKNGITELERSLTYSKLKSLLRKMRKQEVRVFFPKFKNKNKYMMRKTLKSMGMSDAFGRQADFSGMDGTKNLYISNVIHQAFVEVDEKGTEAAAATAVIMMEKSMASVIRIPIFKADHPFIYMIRENSTGNILFMGRMNNPGK